MTLVLLTGTVYGQELRGKVQGFVSDGSGAVVSGATVSLQNDKAGTAETRQTSSSGQYLFDLVLPGTYTLTVEMAGFRKYVQRNILVQTRADITVNAVMELGQLAETVNVTEAPVSVKFNTTSMDLTLDTKMTNDLPIIHRNPFLLATLNPAVVVRSTTEQSPYHHWAANQMDVGGGTSTKNDVLVDGVPQLVGAKGGYVPPMDAVSEVNVQQNAVDAEFGHSAGGILSVQMKSGTNEWHGTAYYFGRNPKLNAPADRTTVPARPNTVRNNVFGGTLQSPIIKNRIFNAFTYEAHKVSEPRTMALTLPSAAERTGDFSNSRTIDGALRTIYDPLTTVVSGNTSTRTPFAGNIIPATRIDRTAARFMQDIWQPNNPGDNITGANNYRENYPQKFDYWNFSDRVDYNVTDAVRVFGRVSRFHTIQSDPNFTGSPAQQLAGSARHSFSTSGDMVWTINPTTVFNIRGSYLKITDSFYAENALVPESFLGELWPGNAWYQPYLAELPAIYYPGIQVRSETTSDFGRNGFWYQEPKTWNLQAKVSKQMGKHYLKIGGEYRHQLGLAARPRPMGFRFDKGPTASTIFSPNLRASGDAYATMLLGVVDGSLTGENRISTIPLNKPINGFYGFYVQDDYKLSQRVTLNLGLRYEYQTALYDPEDRLSRTVDFSQPIPELANNPPTLPSEVTALRPQAPVYNGAWIFTDSDNRGMWNPQGNLFLPRVGIAYRVNDRTALRVGYARYAVASDSVTSVVDVLGSVPYTGFEQTTTPLPLLAGVPQAFLSNPYPSTNPLIAPIGKSRGIYTSLGSSPIFFEQNYRNEVNDRFNVSIQRQVWSQIVVDVTYFANFGHNAAQNINVNLMDPRLLYQNKAALSAQVSNPFYQILTPEKFPGQLRNAQRVSVGSLLVPYPHYGTLTQRGIPMSSTRYHSLQLSVQRPFANGFNLLFGYNYNRGRAQEFYDDQDTYDRILNYQTTNSFLPRNKLTIAAIYQFPFGKGRRWLSNANPIVDGILGGWSTSGIFLYTSGVFLRFGAMEQVGDPVLDDPSNAARFNTAAFKVIQPFTRRSNPLWYEGVTGPGFRNIDMTLQKEFPITERVRFELKMEAYNFTNSFNGANPSVDVNSSVFGRVVQQAAGYYGRQLQYSGRFRW